MYFLSAVKKANRCLAVIIIIYHRKNLPTSNIDHLKLMCNGK